jgi:hypothetical protein
VILGSPGAGPAEPPIRKAPERLEYGLLSPDPGNLTISGILEGTTGMLGYVAAAPVHRGLPHQRDANGPDALFATLNPLLAGLACLACIWPEQARDGRSPCREVDVDRDGGA